ncbi:hypothetical protein [Streptomyces sp. ALI-76-A]|uniref:hypothetical protein n=1 Tax=Streptomyces sp. ALI-76-A TaxID=3025736 RepID=UPI00256F0A90|nr:hypothetical protein [Streptomyces sp. ALI-76-A]MDL5200634.1 hypothetical protein [Streptomyces sp. ALI-76-A]
MSWTRGLLAVLAVCVLLLAGSAGCGSDGTQQNGTNETNGTGGGSPSPVGELLEDTDKQGRRYREVDQEGAPDVGIEVQPAEDAGGWNVRLTLRDFRFSPAGAKAEAVAGRGVARLFVNGHPVAVLRTPEYRLSDRYVPHGTHHLTARLYADDGTVWAVDGEPVESTADITASGPASGGEGYGHGDGDGEGTGAGKGALSAPGVPARTEGRGVPDGFPDHGGKAS